MTTTGASTSARPAAVQAAPSPAPSAPQGEQPTRAAAARGNDGAAAAPRDTTLGGRVERVEASQARVEALVTAGNDRARALEEKVDALNGRMAGIETLLKDVLAKLG